MLLSAILYLWELDGLKATEVTGTLAELLPGLAPLGRPVSVPDWNVSPDVGVAWAVGDGMDLEHPALDGGDLQDCSLRFLQVEAPLEALSCLRVSVRTAPTADAGLAWTRFRSAAGFLRDLARGWIVLRPPLHAFIAPFEGRSLIGPRQVPTDGPPILLGRWTWTSKCRAAGQVAVTAPDGQPLAHIGPLAGGLEIELTDAAMQEDGSSVVAAIQRGVPCLPSDLRVLTWRQSGRWDLEG